MVDQWVQLVNFHNNGKNIIWYMELKLISCIANAMLLSNSKNILSHYGENLNLNLTHVTT